MYAYVTLVVLPSLPAPKVGFLHRPFRIQCFTQQSIDCDLTCSRQIKGVHMVFPTLGIVGLPPTIVQTAHIFIAACGANLIHFCLVKSEGSLVKDISLNDGPHVYNWKGSPIHRLYAKIATACRSNIVETYFLKVIILSLFFLLLLYVPLRNVLVHTFPAGFLRVWNMHAAITTALLSSFRTLLIYLAKSWMAD